ncbi:MAG: selenium metabolism-associated LysR family transcriptional regulator [Firmicutes bacterium]|nr:selenium metabolism-associated LysR family transcriptional regulator [Bacillota bacterium]
MDFKQIEAFINVVRYKSFSKAADATFFTQPTISTHISNLEKELGIKLLDRKGRTVEMTPQGSIFYKYAIEMINARSQAIDALGNTLDMVEGILELQTSSIPGLVFVPEILSGFRKMYTNTRFYVALSDTDTVVDNIVNRRGEIGFIGVNPSNPAIESHRIFTDKVVLLAPKSYGLKDSISLKEAVRYPFIWRETGSATRKSFEDAALKLGFDKSSFDIAATFNDFDAILRSIEEGLGVSIISRKTAEIMSNDRLQIVDISDFEKEREFYMISLRNSSLSPVGQAFKEYVIERIEK